MEALQPIEESLTSAASPGTLFVLSVYEDERPLKGSTGMVDWRLRGNLSRHVVAGHIQGKLYEFTYLPVRYHGGVRHVLLVGLGPKDSASDSAKLLTLLRTKVEKLGFKKAILSRSRFPMLADTSRLENTFKGIELEIKE